MATDKECMKRWSDFGGKAGQYCRECKERYIGCHSTCEKYIESKRQMERRKKQIEAAKMEEKIYRTYKSRKIMKERGNS